MQEKSEFEKSSDWLLKSGIQNGSGAFSAWLDLDKGKNSFEYSEITGYAITTLSYLNSIQTSAELVKKAEKAAKWLSKNAITQEGAVLARNYQKWEKPNEKFSFNGGNCFSFDAGMVLNGFGELYNETGKQELLDSALKIGNFLIDNMMENGKMHAIYNVNAQKIVDTNDKWSTGAGPYHAKIAIGLLKLADATRNEKFGDAAVAICKNALEQQLPSGRFVTNPSNESTHLHPHCYTAEGLLFAGMNLSEQRFIDAAENAVAWALENQQKDGGVNAYFDGEWNKSQRSDVLAQVLRLALVLKSIGRLQSVRGENILALKNRLLEFRHETGGFLYGKELDLSEKNCVNAWCTMFALQALEWEKAEKIDFGRLI